MLDTNLSLFTSSLLDAQKTLDFPSHLTKNETIAVIRQLVSHHPLDFTPIIDYAAKLNHLPENDLRLLKQQPNILSLI
jgi:hypothetical protein